MLSALQGSIGPMSLSAAAQGRPCWPSGADQTPEPSVQQPVLGTNPPRCCARRLPATVLPHIDPPGWALGRGKGSK